MTEQTKDTLDLRRVPYARSLAECLKVRWLGPDGGARTGCVVHHDARGVTAVDLLRQEVVQLHDGWYERDQPKDDEGNVR